MEISMVFSTRLINLMIFVIFVTVILRIICVYRIHSLIFNILNKLEDNINDKKSIMNKYLYSRVCLNDCYKRRVAIFNYTCQREGRLSKKA
jgi:hypothetical protein